jgi:salicylate hydroxylase
MKDARIAVVGGGIGGLTTALALQRAGFRVRVYEQSPVLGEVGAGLTITPNAAHGLYSLGLREVLEGIGHTPDRQAVKHWQDGRVLVEIPRGRERMQRLYGAGYYFMHRADLHDALADAVRATDPEAIQLDHRCTDVEERDHGVRLGFNGRAAIDADLVIGADGVRSVIRDRTFGLDRPRFTGYIAWRGLVSREYLSDEVFDPTGCLYIGPGHMVARYLIRHGAEVNYVAVAERSGWEEEGWAIPSTVGEILDEFAGWNEHVRQMIAATPPERCFKWALHDRDPLSVWSRGNVTLLGDAAHGTLPFLGQGAAMAIEDGVVLARCIAAATDIQEALRRYEAARKVRGNFIVLTSREVVKRFHSPDTDQYRRPTEQSEEEALGLFDYNPATVPV